MIIQNHGDEIADFIIQELAPKEICKELGFCIKYELNDCKFYNFIELINTNQHNTILFVFLIYSNLWFN